MRKRASKASPKKDEDNIPVENAESPTPSPSKRGRPRKNAAVTESGGVEKKRLAKGASSSDQDDSYKEKRSKNNQAVAKCRQNKSKQVTERKAKVEALRQENEQLASRSVTLQKQCHVLSSLMAPKPQQDVPVMIVRTSAETVPVQVAKPSGIVNTILSKPGQQTSPLGTRVILRPVTLSPAVATSGSTSLSPSTRLPSPTLSLSLVPPSASPKAQVSSANKPKMVISTSTAPQPTVPNAVRVQNPSSVRFLTQAITRP